MVDLRTRWLGLDLAHPLLTDVEEEARNAAAVVAEPRRIAALKKACRVPLIATLRGESAVERAPRAVEAGAEGVELDLASDLPDPWDPPQLIERRAIGQARALRARVRVPLAVRLSPFYTSVPHMARAMEEAGADGLVLAGEGEVVARLTETLFGMLRIPIAVAGGDVLGALSRGARAVVLRGDLRRAREELSRWLERHEIPSLGALEKRVEI